MRFTSPLVQGTLIKRYKRFLADVRMEDGEIITVTVPIPARCSPARLQTVRSAFPDRITQNVNTPLPWKWSRIIRPGLESILHEPINWWQRPSKRAKSPNFRISTRIKTEIKTSDHTRLDLQVNHGNSSTFIEVKNCSLAVDRCAMFPDAVTTRGTKHLHELIRLTVEGRRACIFFLVQRMDADRFSPASHIDLIYGEALLRQLKQESWCSSIKLRSALKEFRLCDRFPTPCCKWFQEGLHHFQIQFIIFAIRPNLIEVKRSMDKSGLSMSHDQ